MTSDRPTIALVNQPWGHIEPPVRTGGSIPILLYELARRMTKSARVLYYLRGKYLPHSKTVEDIEYRYLPVFADKALLKALDYSPFAEKSNKPNWSLSPAYFTFGLQLALDLRRQKANFIQLTNLSQHVPIVRFFNPKAIIALHMHCEWLSQLDRGMIHDRIRHADLIFGVSNFISDRVRRQFPEFADRCRTLYNGVDLARFTERSEAPLDAPPHKIVYVGRISPDKGIHVLIDAFSRIAAEFPDVQLDLVGPDEINSPSMVVPLSNDPELHKLLPLFSTPIYRAHLAKLITPELRPRINFIGPLPHGPGLVAAYAAGDICVIPSAWDEPGSIPVAEAMATGAAVIATRSGGLPEVVEEGKTGLLVERANPVELASALRRLLLDSALRRRLGHAARQSVVERFTWDRSAQTALDYFRTAAPLAARPDHCTV
jgi:glycosyltransferase involved in cell wall biosynthesis